MVLHVEFSRLADEAKRYGIKPVVYLQQCGTRVCATLADPSTRAIVQSETRGPLERAIKQAEELGLEATVGRWTPDPMAGEITVQEQIWVAAVAYRSSVDKPGLWVHGYRGSPSTGDVLKDFFEEMSSETDLGGIALEEFVAAVTPNVVVLGPDELAAFAEAGERSQ